VQKALKNKEFLCLYSLALAFYEKMSKAECKIAFSYSTRHNRKQTDDPDRVMFIIKTFTMQGQSIFDN